MYQIMTGGFAIFIALATVIVLVKGEFTGGIGSNAENPTRLTRGDFKYWVIVIVLLAITVFLAGCALLGWPFSLIPGGRWGR